MTVELELERTEFEHAEPVVAERTPFRDQILAAGGQIVTGGGNFLFAIICARLLEPRDFAHLAAFLAAYVLVHVFAGSVGAGAALDPDRADRTAATMWRWGLVAALVTVIASAPLGRLLGIGTGPTIALGAALPFAGALAALRGRLYGTSDVRRVVASLLAEPLVRLTCGVALAMWVGQTGAAFGIIIAGAVAFAVAARIRARTFRWRSFSIATEPHTPAVSAEQAPPSDAGGHAVVSFLALAVVMNQDVLLANRLLPAEEAARFAVLSTLGGMAAFATTTVPLVLLGQRAREHALRTALVIASSIGLGAVLVVAVANRLLVGLLFGDRYAALAARAAPYVLAMAILGVVRVLVAHLCANGLGTWAKRFVVLAAASQFVAIVTQTRTALGVAAVTLGTTTSLLVVVAGAELVRRRAWIAVGRAVRTYAHAARDQLHVLRSSGTAKLVGALTLLALAVRCIVLRSLWLDEAIAVSQAHLRFDVMLSALRNGDVHPPLHATILWGVVRTIGDGEIAVRLPSIAAGTLMIPVLYLLGRELYDHRTGLIAATLGVFAPFLVWYSQEARMYAIFMLFSVLAALGQACAIRRGRTFDWGLYAVSTALLIWTQYFAVLQIVAQQVIFAVALWNRRRDRPEVKRYLAGWAASSVAVILAVLPLISFLGAQLDAYVGRSDALDNIPAQAGHGATGTGPGLSVYAALANLVWAVWGYHSDPTMAQVVALWPLGMLFVLFLLGRGWSRDTASLVAIIVVPMGALYALGLAKRNLFEIRYLAGIAPALLVLASRVLTVGFKRRAMRIAATVVLIATLGAGLVDQQVNGANPRLYDFRGALAEVEEIARPGDEVVYMPSYLQPILAYYSPQLRAHKLGKTVPNDGKRIILLASFIDQKATAAQAGWALSHLEERYTLQGRIDRPRVRVWVFG